MWFDSPPSQGTRLRRSRGPPVWSRPAIPLSTREVGKGVLPKLFLVVLAVAWIVVLVPPVLRARSDSRNRGDSIGDFQNRLGVLSRSHSHRHLRRSPRASRAAQADMSPMPGSASALGARHAAAPSALANAGRPARRRRRVAHRSDRTRTPARGRALGAPASRGRHRAVRHDGAQRRGRVRASVALRLGTPDPDRSRAAHATWWACCGSAATAPTARPQRALPAAGASPAGAGVRVAPHRLVLR